MDLTIRDWMVIIGVLLIAAVLVDAWRRVRSERSERVRVKIARTDDEPDGEPLEHPSVQRELPNGGARVVRREDLMRARREHSDEVARADGGFAQDGAHDNAAQQQPADAPPSPQPSAPSRRAVAAADRGAPVKPAPVRQSANAGKGDDGLVSGLRGERQEPANLDWLDDLPAVEGDDEPEQEGRLPRDPDPEVFMLHVVANDPTGFRGEDIMHILLACDLRFGDMDFFHRHEQSAGRGPIQFSVANMMQPGVFDIDRMSELSTQGLLFFVTLPGPEDMMKAFDYMLETAQAVARNLGGSVLDESRSVVTPQTLEHSRQQIRELERRMLARAR
ncbi:MAG: cell division protein ZipA [Chromatocurvus sp.]